MQEHNFERQVKDTMENFSVPPSAPVWQKIEKEIGQKKERRRLVLWLLPLLCAGVVWLVLSDYSSRSNEASATIQNIPASTEQTSPAKGPLAPVDLEETKSEDVTASTNKQPQTSSTPMDTREVSDKIVTGKHRSFIYSGKSAYNNQSKKPRATTSVSENKNPASPTTNPAISSLNTGTNSDTSKIITKEPEAVPDILPAAEITKAAPEVLQPDITTDTAALAIAEPKIEPATRPRKWKISVQGTVGYAQTLKTFFPSTAMPELNNVPTSIGYIPRVRPIEPTPGPAFSAGVVFTNTLSTRMKFTTGFQFNYASTFQQFGEKSVGTWNGVAPQSIDSSTVLYRSGNQFRYTNKYHFAEIPAAAEMRLFSTLPVDLHAGISLSILIASNAVSFDQSNDLYYNQKDKLNALGVNLHGGFSYSFAKERLKIGPHLQYNLMPVHIGGDKRYLLTGGIRTRFSLN